MIKQFNGERGYSTKEHLVWFLDWIDLEEVDHDNVKVRIFSQSLAEEARKWYKILPDDSSLIYQAFEESFKDKWADKKNPNQYLFQYHSMRRRESESIHDFSYRFMKLYNAIPSQFKTPIGSFQL